MDTSAQSSQSTKVQDNQAVSPLLITSAHPSRLNLLNDTAALLIPVTSAFFFLLPQGFQCLTESALQHGWVRLVASQAHWTAV